MSAVSCSICAAASSMAFWVLKRVSSHQAWRLEKSSVIRLMSEACLTPSRQKENTKLTDTLQQLNMDKCDSQCRTALRPQSSTG